MSVAQDAGNACVRDSANEAGSIFGAAFLKKGAMKEKVCKNCKFFVKGDKCPLCQMSSFTRTWKGMVFIKDPQNSEVAQLLGIKVPGKYCLWAK